MKILEIVFDLRPGGAERFALDLSNELSKTNDVTLLAIKDDTIEPEKALFYKTELSNRVLYKNLGIGKGFSVKMAWRVYKEVKKENPNVVHLHGHGMPIYCFLAILFLNRKTKFYQTIHSNLYNGYTTPFYKFLIKTFGYRKKMGFVALSETNYKDMVRVYPKVKGTCIVNGRAPILPSTSYEVVTKEMENYKLNNNSKLYLHVARCGLVKNQTLLVKAFNSFVERGHNADLVIIGDGFDSELGLFVKKNAGSRVHIIGTRNNVGDYMLNADMFCLSSDYEGMPITILEANLAGVPIVSTPVCGAVDVVKDGENGILSEGHSLEDYVKALERSYAHIDELKAVSIKMKDSSPYTIEICAKKYVEFFSL